MASMSSSLEGTTPPEEVERVLSNFFLELECSDGSVTRFSDESFDRIAELLALFGRPGWAERPRTYAILRVIGSPELLQQFIDANLFDIAIPYIRSRLVPVLPSALISKFIKHQTLAVSGAYDLEKADGRHQHLEHDADQYFTKVRELGSGGQGSVDCVRSKLSLKCYARKRFSRFNILWQDQHALSNVMRELKSLKQLNHHHLVSLVSSYTDPKFVGIIMKEVADCNLKEYLEQSPFPQTLKPLVRGFYGSLISAVAYLHRSQMRHKDLKPQNVLVMDNKVMITDFGVALDWSENKNSQSIGRPIGGLVYTPEYMAPELEDWQPRNSQTDIYSLGLIFADILCILKGRTLVEREAYFKKLGTRTPLMRTNPAASEAWFASLERESREDNQPIRWIREMTAKRPDDRTRADVMLKKIQTFSDGEYRYYPLCCEHAELGDDHDLHQAKLSMTKKAEEEQQAAELKRSSEADAQKLAAADKEAGSADDQSFLASAKKGNLVMVKRHLLDPYANIEAKDEGGRTAMHFAAQMGLSSMMEHLIISLGNIEALDKENWTPLHYAALNGNLDEVVTLLENNALIEAQTDEGDCALHLSCRNGREDIVKELLLRGADIDRENYTGWTALFQATRAGHESIVKLLLDAPSIYPGRIKEGANLEATLDGGLNSLHIAARFGHVPLVELFIERGLDYDYPSEDGFTALHFAAQADQKAVAEVLLKRGALLNAGTKDGITPLHLAAINHSEDMAYFLIDKGADIHAINTSLMFTPLHYAATYGEFNILAVLLMNGAKIMERDFRDYTVLHCTTLPEGDGGEEAHYACAEYLLDQGIEVDARASQGLTTLHLACLRGLESIVRLLLRHKADIHAEDSETYTALDFAVIGGKKGIVSLLLERGADLGKADGRAMTIAIRRGNEEVTRLLAENGASLDEYPELLPILQIQVVRQIPISRTHSHSSRATQAMFGEAMSQNFNGHGRLRAEDQWETYTGVSDDVSEEDRLAIEAVLAEEEAEHFWNQPRRNSPNPPRRSHPQVREVPGAEPPIRRSSNSRLQIIHKIEELSDSDEIETPAKPLSRTEDDHMEAMDRLSRDGFDKLLVVEAYRLAEGDEDLARNILFEVYEGYESCEIKYVPGSLFKVTRKSDIAELKILLAHECDINELDKQTDQTALMCAAAMKRKEFVEVLIQHGADVATTNSRGYTALHYATRAGDLGITELLLGKGANPEAESKDGWTPLGCAAKPVQELLKTWLEKERAKEAEEEARLAAEEDAKKKGISYRPKPQTVESPVSPIIPVEPLTPVSLWRQKPRVQRKVPPAVKPKSADLQRKFSPSSSHSRSSSTSGAPINDTPTSSRSTTPAQPASLERGSPRLSSTINITRIATPTLSGQQTLTPPARARPAPHHQVVSEPITASTISMQVGENSSRRNTVAETRHMPVRSVTVPAQVPTSGSNDFDLLPEFKEKPGQTMMNRALQKTTTNPFTKQKTSESGWSFQKIESSSSAGPSAGQSPITATPKSPSASNPRIAAAGPTGSSPQTLSGSASNPSATKSQPLQTTNTRPSASNVPSAPASSRPVSYNQPSPIRSPTSPSASSSATQSWHSARSPSSTTPVASSSSHRSSTTSTPYTYPTINTPSTRLPPIPSGPHYTRPTTTPLSPTPNSPSPTPSTILSTVTQGDTITLIALLKRLPPGTINSIRDSAGNTLLHLAVQSGTMLKVWHLLKQGADVNAINEEGDTPVMVARRMGEGGMVNLLKGGGKWVS